ncbi:pain [Trypoxylus dichotomus]
MAFIQPDMYQDIAGQSELIHLAVKDQNPQVLKIVVNSNPDRLNATEKGNTALNLLIKHGKMERASFMECLDILLAAGIDVNIADETGITPILWACRKGYQDVIGAILECRSDVDIDTHKYAGKTARDYILHPNVYNEDLNALENNENIIRSALWYVENKDEEGFFKLREIDVNEENEEGTLLQHACERGLINVVKYLVDHNVDVQKTTYKNKKIPLNVAALKGHDEIFKILLSKYDPIPNGTLKMLLTNMHLYECLNPGYEKCLDALLDNEMPISVNERTHFKNTPLHYASVINDPSIPLKLLKKGASLANRNDFDCIPIEDLDSKILEQHFNDCIGGSSLNKDKRSITVHFDYRTILPTFDEVFNETDVIRVINETPELRHLLIHPLIASFIRIKWHRMRWFFWINLILFMLFATCFFVYVFVPAGKNLHDDLKLWVNILWVLLVITYIMVFLRELSQLILSYRTYCCSLSNILEVGMLIACFYPIFYKSTDTMYKQFCSAAMVLIALELMVLGAQHPRLSMYMVMLRTVAKNFFFFLLWYAMLIFAFALGFYVLYNKNSNFNTNSDVEDETVQEDTQPFFSEVGLTIIKTIVMLAGEFDASSINFDSFWNRVIFILFVFVISIILFNLLNGLAVNDTQQIKSKAEIVGYAERVSFIVYIENIFRGQRRLQQDNCLISGCREGWRFNLVPKSSVQRISLIPYYLPERKANVNLYHDGLVKESNSGTEGWFHKLARVHIDKKTLKRVKQILYERSAESVAKKQIQSQLHIIDSQKNLLDQQRKEIDRLKARQT